MRIVCNLSGTLDLPRIRDLRRHRYLLRLDVLR